MKVIVTGSYRLHEPDFHFEPGRWEEFKVAARTLGKNLAQSRHTLLLSWSNVNMLSQLGAKENVRGNPASHPYWETADYHALMGYLEHVQDNPNGVEKASIVVYVLGKHPQFPGIYPFPRPAVLGNIQGLFEHASDDRPEAPRLEEFEESGWIDLEPHVRSGVVFLQPYGLIYSIQMRQQMLEHIADETGATIVLGGGKATEKAAKAARSRKKLIVISPYCARGAFCDVDRSAAIELPNLARAMRSLAHTPPRSLEQVAAEVPHHLGALAAAEHPPKIIVVTMRVDEFHGFQRHLRLRAEWTGRNQSYETGILQHVSGRPLRVGLIQAREQGEIAAQQITANLIEDTDPRLIIFCGIAGGLATADFTLGDVIVSTRIHYFGPGAVLGSGMLELGQQGGPITHEASELVARIARLVGNGELGDWNADAVIGQPQPGIALKADSFPGGVDVEKSFHHHFDADNGHAGRYRRRKPHPIVHSRAIGGDGNLMKSAAVAEQWRYAARDLGAVEMESGGAYRACQTKSATYNLLTIRALSDVIGLKRDDAWTTYAAYVAGSFCCSFLKTLPEPYASDL
ncbi:MAG TPA: hypothetical protein VLM79_19485 [Kofleriaceae bacterium]|nr:hypothetical protein [Kofleriaceae bacterium]